MRYGFVLGRKTLLAVVGSAILATALSAHAGSRQLSISGAPPATVKVGEFIKFTPTVTRANQRKLTFSIHNAPGWVWFNPRRGLIMGAPGKRDVGHYGNVLITVTDGISTSQLRPFSIAVVQRHGSTPPGTKPDPTPKPPAPKPPAPKPPAPTPPAPTPPAPTPPAPTPPAPTPPAPDPQPTTGSTLVSWTPPTTNTDGSALVDLAGYRIVYGTAANALTHEVYVRSAGVASYMIDNLALGTWYFAVRAYSSSGVESQNSMIASRRIQ